MDENRPDRIRPVAAPIRAVAGEAFDYLAKSFPVCCGSDEFFYFPQVVPPSDRRSGWDDFSTIRIEDAKRRLSAWESGAGLLAGAAADREEREDAAVLHRLLRTLREQLEEVRFHETQPTFHLTVLCTGLAAALGSGDREAWGNRVRTAPAFLARARETLAGMPRPFRDLGAAMVADAHAWLRTLDPRGEDLARLNSALARFGEFLGNARVKDRFLLPPGVFGRVVRDHIGCAAGADEVREAIVEELRETAGILDGTCAGKMPGGDWREAIRSLPPPELSGGDLLKKYAEEIDGLLEHCLGIGIVPSDLPGAVPLSVRPLPPYLRAVRAASSYAFTPGDAGGSGTFHVVLSEGSGDGPREDPADIRMLAAHETWPGHHLLDSRRWRHSSPVRRSVELPLFYEGWACFAEELMRFTGYFSGPDDLLILARRRHRRAVRGLIDLDLQTGALDPGSAAALLARTGIPPAAAASAVAKYALRPGYQVCYSLGLRRFLDLYARYGEGGAGRFAGAVLSGGETGFDLVEDALRRAARDPGAAGSGRTGA